MAPEYAIGPRDGYTPCHARRIAIRRTSLAAVAHGIVKRPSLRLIVVAAVALAAAAVVAWRVALGTAVPTIAATRGEVVQTVVSTGRVITPARVEIGTVVLGTVKSREVEEGATVKAGQVLARLKDEEQRAAVEQARGTLAEAEARLNQLGRLTAPASEQSLREKEANLALAQDEYERTKRLFEKGFFSQAKLDEAARNLTVARAARESAVLQATSNNPKGSDHALALARREQARAALEVAEVKLDNTVIRAPAAGVVLKKYVENGDTVAQGKKLFDLSVAGETQVVLNVDEKNIRLLDIGRKAQVVADAYPGRMFGAEVFYIAAGVDAQRGSIEVKLRVPDAPAFLKPDMTVSAEMLAGRKPDAVTLPADAVRDASTTAPWVLAVRDGRAVKVPVKVGLRGSDRIEILDGVQPGDRVIPAGANVTPGKRVRAAD
jgi:HlyD family secretion protein